MSTISQLLLPEFDQEMANTRKILERYPEGKPDFAPHPKSMTLARLAGHVAELPSWAAMTMKTEVLEMDSSFKAYVASTPQDLVDTFDKHVREARAALEGATDPDFQVVWTFKWAGKTVMSMPRYAVIRSVTLNHLIHHRAQLGVYLRLNEIEIPGMYGPSADEAKFWESKGA